MDGSFVEQHKSPEIRINGASGGDFLAFSVWNGSLRFGVFDSKQRGRPSISKNLNNTMRLVLIGLLKGLKAASPDTKKPILASEWNPEQKKFLQSWSMTMVKDSAMIYHIELQTSAGSSRFTLKGPSGIALGTEPMSDSTRSAIALDELIDYLESTAKIDILLTGRKYDPNAQRGGGGRPSGGGMGGGQGGAVQPAEQNEFSL